MAGNRAAWRLVPEALSAGSHPVGGLKRIGPVICSRKRGLREKALGMPATLRRSGETGAQGAGVATPRAPSPCGKQTVNGRMRHTKMPRGRKRSWLIFYE